MVKKRKPTDVYATAFEIPQAATGEPAETPIKKKDQLEKNPAAVALGRLGGLKGGEE